MTDDDRAFVEALVIGLGPGVLIAVAGLVYHLIWGLPE